jgi:hypothetical protein
MKAQIKKILDEAYGKFETELELEYASLLEKGISSEDWRVREEWATYNQIILELKHNMNDMISVKELQYKLTDNEQPEIACKSILENIKRNSELDRLYNKIINYGKFKFKR